MNVELIDGKESGTYPVKLIGGKAHGLIKLKRMKDWLTKNHSTYLFRQGIIIPDFFIIPTGYDLKSGLEAILKKSEAMKTDKFAVRSSSPFEDGTEYSFDGVFHTELNVPRAELADAIDKVKTSALGDKARRYADSFGLKINDLMAVIVQKMVDENIKGVIYSKFPAIMDVTRVSQEVNNIYEDWIIEREMNSKGKLHDGRTLVEPKESELRESGAREIGCLARCSYSIEKKFGNPVRIEYQTNDGFSRLFLLQARAISGMNKSAQITQTNMPALGQPGLLIGSNDVNGQGDYTLPAVVIIARNEDCNRDYNLMQTEVEELDRKFSDGYILICDHLEFDNIEWDSVTPNKKAIVAGSSMGSHHGRDIARQKGLLYIGAQSFARKYRIDALYDEKPVVKTGDIVRAVSDGINGYLCLVKRKD